MDTQPHSTTLIPNVCYAAPEGTPLYLDILKPKSPPAERIPVIMELHTGAWTYGEKDAQRNRLFAEQGFFTVSVDYRLSGQTTFPAQIEDVKTAVRWLRSQVDTYGIDPARIGVWGLSAGGHLAALLGLSDDRDTPESQPRVDTNSAQVQAVATIAAPTDILNLNGEFEHLLLGGPVSERMELARLASPIAFVSSTAPPFLLIHGTRDERVPFEQAASLRDKLQNAGADVTLLAIEQGDHMQLFQQHEQTIMGAMLNFFTTHLRSSSPLSPNKACTGLAGTCRALQTFFWPEFFCALKRYLVPPASRR